MYTATTWRPCGRGHWIGSYLALLLPLFEVALSSPLSCLYYSTFGVLCQDFFSTFLFFFECGVVVLPLCDYSIANVGLFVNPFREKKFFYFLIKFLLTKAETCVIMEILPAHIRARGAKLMPIKKRVECQPLIFIFSN